MLEVLSALIFSLLFFVLVENFIVAGLLKEIRNNQENILHEIDIIQEQLSDREDGETDPHSLRVKLKRLNSKGLLRDTDTDRLIKALDTVDGLQDAIEEIKDVVSEEKKEDAKWATGLQYSLLIIRRHTGVNI